MKKFIYVFNETEKNELEKQGFRLLKDSNPFIFANDTTKQINFDNKKIIFSNTMQF